MAAMEYKSCNFEVFLTVQTLLRFNICHACNLHVQGQWVVQLYTKK